MDASSSPQGYSSVYILAFIVVQILLWNIREIKRNSHVEVVPLSIILILIAVTFIAIPLSLVLLVIFVIYRQIISLVLKAKYGTKFRGMISGADAFHTVSEPSSSMIQILMVFQDTAKRPPQEFFAAIKQVASKLAEVPKFSSTFYKFFGYHCVLQEDVDVDDVFRQMRTIECRNEKMEMDELIGLLNECDNAPLSKNGKTTLWHGFVGIQPLNWKNDDNVYYPVVLRCHHGVCDGVALIKILIGSLADKHNIEEISSTKFLNKPPQPPQDPTTPAYNKFIRRTSPFYHFILSAAKSFSGENSAVNLGVTLGRFTRRAFSFYNWSGKVLRVFADGFCVFALMPASLVVSMTLKGNDRNILHGAPLSGQKVIAMRTETSSEYFQKVKRIKTMIPGVSFPEVLLTAYSASLASYFKKKTGGCPERITAAIPIVLEATQLPHLKPGNLDINTVDINNSFSIIVMEVPLAVDDKGRFDKDTPLLNRLKMVQREITKFKNSVDYQVNYFITLISALVPHPLTRFGMSCMQCTAGVSILPGTQKAFYDNGTIFVEDSAFWLPHSHDIGTAFTVFTYNNHLQIGVSADKVLISDQDDLQSIADGVYDHIALLEEEIDRVSEECPSPSL